MSAAGPVVRVRVPASTANLGPGFDTLGMALALHDDVEVSVLPPGAGLRVHVAGEAADAVPLDESHLVVRALRAACTHAGHPVADLLVCCVNRIPHARGLGSSASAVVAGVAAGYVLAGGDPEALRTDPDVLDLAGRFEGHADNVAASLLGGVVLTWHESRYRAVRLDAHPTLRPVALVPATRSSTEQTRGLLPATVPHRDAAHAAGRTALALHALTRDPSMLLAGTDDRLHQQYRRSAYPETLRLVDELRAAGVAATVSGAGPTVLALTVDGTLPESVGTGGFVAHELPVDGDGVRVGLG